MEHDMCGKDCRCARTPQERSGRRLLTRLAAAAIGGGLLLTAASPATGQSRSAAAGPPAGPTLSWLAREFQDGVNGPDNAVDIAYWIDLNGPGSEDDVPYVFITWYHTTDSGATVFATFRYLANYTGPGENEPDRSAFFPAIAIATGTNKAVAMSIDDATGDVYVTGESTDPEGVNGQDYVTIKYDKDLVGAWSGERRYDGPVNDDDVPVDVTFVPSSGEPGLVLVTGRSRGGVTGDDIATVLYDALTGVPSAPLWPNEGDGPGVRRYSGDGFEGDEPVGVLGVALVEEIPPDVLVVVGGTISTLAQGKDIVTLAYAADVGGAGSLVQVRVFNGVDSGDDVATGMVSLTSGVGLSYDPLGSFVAVCGYTPHDEPGSEPHPNDTDYVVLNYTHKDGFDFLRPAWSGNQPARFFNGLAPPEFSDDRPLAIDVGHVSPWNPLNYYVWITGRVREADGTDYDVATIVYKLNVYNSPAYPFYQLIWGVLTDTNEWGTAVDAHGNVAYVGGRVSRGTINNYATFKFDVARAYTPEWTALYRAWQASDTIEAIVGLVDVVDPVFVTGGSGLSATGKDQLSLRYDQP